MPIHDVLFPTDLGPESEAAFATALRIALAAHGTLRTVHVVSEGGFAHWWSLPTVREMLVRWGVLPATATVDDYAKLGLRVQMHAVRGRTVDAVLSEALDRPFDLVVMSTHHREALDRWVRPSVSEPIARRAHVPALFLPSGGRGLVDAATGEVTLRRVVVPVKSSLGGYLAVDAATELATLLGVPRCSGTFVHVGGAPFPEVDLQGAARDWAWDTRLQAGAVVEEIQRVAQDDNADLIAMATAGHDSIRDVLLGSTTERVLRNTDRPVLAVPLLA